MITKEVDKRLVGQRLRTIRRSKNITQKQLAEGTNYSKSYIGDIETGRTQPSLKALMAIVEYLNAEPSDFFDAECCYERMIKGDGGYCNTSCEHQLDCPLTNLSKLQGESV